MNNVLFSKKAGAIPLTFIAVVIVSILSSIATDPSPPVSAEIPINDVDEPSTLKLAIEHATRTNPAFWLDGIPSSVRAEIMTYRAAREFMGDEEPTDQSRIDRPVYLYVFEGSGVSYSRDGGDLREWGDVQMVMIMDVETGNKMTTRGFVEGNELDDSSLRLISLPPNLDQIESRDTGTWPIATAAPSPGKR